jgi:hypothetical protein
MQKVTVGHFVVRKLENPHILRTPIFSAAKIEKESAQIKRVNTVYVIIGTCCTSCRTVGAPGLNGTDY